MKNTPLFSIITVVRNNEVGILRTLKSIQNQDFRNFEHIIIDGASNDGTIDVIKMFTNEKQIVISEKDNGIYDAMNKGIHLAQGEYIAFLNSGDWYEYNALTLANNILFKNDNIDILHGLLAYYNNNLDLEFVLGESSNSIPNRMIQHPTCFVKANLYKEYLFDINYKSSSDYNTFIRFFLNKFKFYFSPIIFTNFVNDGISQNINSRVESLEIKWKYKFISFKKYLLLKTFYFLIKILKN